MGTSHLSGILGSGLSQPGGFTPLSLPNLYAYWDAEMYMATHLDAPVASNGDTVQQWNDSTNSVLLTGDVSGVTCPTAIYAATPGGKRAVRFAQASSQWLFRAFDLSNGPLFLWSLCRTRSTATEQQFFNVGSAGFSNVSQARFNNSGSQRLTVRANGGAEAIHGTNIVSDTWYRASVLIRSTTDRAVRLNNANEVANATSVAFGNASWLSVGGLTLNGTSASAFLEGDVFALVACTSIPSAAQLAALDLWGSQQ